MWVHSKHAAAMVSCVLVVACGSEQAAEPIVAPHRGELCLAEEVRMHWVHQDGTGRVDDWQDWILSADGAHTRVGETTRTLDTGHRVVDASDWDGDGRPEILSREASGALTLWSSREDSASRRRLAMHDLDPSWQLVDVADMNRDGHRDLVWHGQGEPVRVSYLHGSSLVGGHSILAEAEGEARLVGVGDMQGDGWPDLFWRAAPDTIEIWVMAGAQPSHVKSLDGVPAEWSLAAVHDLNLDGHVDLVWRDSTSRTHRAWYLVDGELVGEASLGEMPAEWRLAAVSTTCQRSCPGGARGGMFTARVRVRHGVRHVSETHAPAEMVCRATETIELGEFDCAPEIVAGVRWSRGAPLRGEAQVRGVRDGEWIERPLDVPLVESTALHFRVSGAPGLWDHSREAADGMYRWKGTAWALCIDDGTGRCDVFPEQTEDCSSEYFDGAIDDLWSL